jgi:GNAT superfamily N-acetyltransferase
MASATSDGFQIKRATPADIDSIHRLLLMQFGEHNIIVPECASEEAIAGVLQDERLGLMIVARDRSETIGMAVISFAWTLEHGGKSAWLDELFVISDRRGRGVGKALLDRVVSEVRDWGCAAIDLELDQGQVRAERPYERAGFQQILRSRWVRYLAD